MNIQTDLLGDATSMLEHLNAKDCAKPSLNELLGVNEYSSVTTSGLNDNDYQNLAVLSLCLKDLQQVRVMNKVPIPNEILEHFQNAKCHCAMGLLPEINRAWLAIDSEIYIWSYMEQHDISYYDGLNHIILAASLIKPKENTFVAEVKYLLVLTTPNDIVVLGVTFRPTQHQNSSGQDLQFLNSPIFIISTDNVAFNVVEGTDDGRIFLGGRDGNLYEIFYQSEATWFKKRCKKINHSEGIVSSLVPNFLKFFSEMGAIVNISIDNSRKLLYVLKENSCIEAWFMGMDYTNMRKIARISENDIISISSSLIRTVDINIFRGIKAICPISLEDSPRLNLVAVTQCGVRFYFAVSSQEISDSNVGPEHIDQQNSVPTMTNELQGHQTVLRNTNEFHGLYLVHIRLPPGYTPNTTFTRPKNVHNALFVNGNHLILSTPHQDSDLLWSISSKSFFNSNFLIESTAVEELDGVSWSFAPIESKFRGTPLSWVQSACKKNEFVFLTNQGVQIMSFCKPLDILRQLLVHAQGPQHDSVKHFFEVQTKEEACITCYLLTVFEENPASDVAIWAIQAFVLYGGEPCIPTQLNTEKSQYQKNVSIRTGGDNFQRKLFGSQITPFNLSYSRDNHDRRQTLLHSHLTDSVITFSPKHDSIYILVARILRSIWNKNCVTQDLCSQISSEECKNIITELRSVRSFWEANCIHDSARKRITYQGELQNSLNGHTNAIDSQENLKEATNFEETRSIFALCYFLKHLCEVLTLWCILNEHGFQKLVMQLSSEQQNILKTCTLKDLAVIRLEVCGYLIIALIDSYLKDDTSVSAISNSLREECPTLYRHEDAVIYKAIEILIKAKHCDSANKRKEMLQLALQLSKDAAPTLPLRRVCQEFMSAGYYEGVIDLTVTCASKSDPDLLGINYYNNGEPADDREGYKYYIARMTCYGEICTMLDHIHQTVACNTKNNHDQSTISKKFGDEFNLSNVNEQLCKVIAQLMRTKEPLMHTILYDWLLNHGMHTELLELKERTLGEHLRRQAERNPENRTYSDLLWKYYEKNGDHIEAAHILDKLSSTRNNNIPLNLRIEYIVKAVMCMRNESVGNSISSGIFLKELEDKLEIARIQKSILNELTSSTTNSNEVSQAICELNCALYDISELYEKYACRFCLWECQLSILNCSHHNDPHLVESIWSNIINQAVQANSSFEISTKLFSTVSNIYRDFGESRNCFPLEFIIRELEIIACRLALPDGIVAEELLKINVDMESILDFYSRAISMNERIWAKEGNELHLVKSAVRVIHFVLSDTSLFPYNAKRRILGKAQDVIAICLSLCFEKSNTEELQKELKQLQCRLERTQIDRKDCN